MLWTCLCLWRLLRKLNVRWHLSHLYDFLAVWVLEWLELLTISSFVLLLCTYSAMSIICAPASLSERNISAPQYWKYPDAQLLVPFRSAVCGSISLWSKTFDEHSIWSFHRSPRTVAIQPAAKQKSAPLQYITEWQMLSYAYGVRNSITCQCYYGLRAHRIRYSSDWRHFGTSAEMSGHIGTRC